MAFFPKTFPHFKPQSIAARMLFFILVCGFVFAFAEASVQLYIDYRTDILFIEEQFQQIENSYLKSLTKSTWNLEADEVTLQLEGAMQLRDIKYLEVKTEIGDILASVGVKPLHNITSRRFPLEYAHQGKTNSIGELYVAAGLDSLHNRLYDKIIILLFSRSIITLFMAGFILFIFYFLVSRHLSTMARYAQGLDLNNLKSPLILNRSPLNQDKSDELENVVSAINEMRERILEEFNEREQALNALWKSEERFRKLAENINDVIWSMDLEFNYTYLSPSVTKLYGWTAEEIPNLKIDDFLPPESMKIAYQTLSENLIESEKTQNYDKSVMLEMEQYKKDGSIIFTELIASLELSADGLPIGISGVTRDITTRKRTQEMMVHAEKMLSLGGLAAGMAHEINNPLAGIIQNTQVVMNRISLDLPANHKIADGIGIPMESIIEYMHQRNIFHLLSSIREAGGRAAQIVSNMLSFSRKDQGFFPDHNVCELLDKTIEIISNDYNLKKKYDFRKIDIIREYGDKIPGVTCDGGSIQQVFLNLLKNAAEAMLEGMAKGGKKTKPAIFIRITRERRMVRIEIEDNGPGMDEATRKRIFEPFFTTKDIGAGTGLGLSVSYFIITETHKGRLSVESLLGVGTKFIIHLPFEQKKT